MQFNISEFLAEHRQLSRRYFLQKGIAGAVVLRMLPLWGGENAPMSLEAAIAGLEPWLTPDGAFRDVSRGTPLPHSLSDEKKREAGLTRETWQLEILSDPDHPSRLKNPLTKEKKTAFDFAALMGLARDHAVRFPKVMTCLNIGCPLGTGIWEGVPLRTVLWLTQPTDNLRRVRYYGYHNDDPKQMFRSSLPVGRVLEDPFDLPPVILCYKLNGEWLSSERGGPVRMVVPEAYGFKSIKWLSHILLSNLAGAQDTYSEKGNDVDSPLKTFCATISVPKEIAANQPIPVTGWAQVGISGLSKVQVWIQNVADTLPEDDRYFTQGAWRDADILPAPATWGNETSDPTLLSKTYGFDDTGKPQTWPLPLTRVHWATLHSGLPAGKYILRCRTIDARGAAQPMPRPFRKSGFNAIEQVNFEVK